MDERDGTGLSGGTGILDSKKDKTFGTSEEQSGERDELSFAGASGVSGTTGTTGTEALNVAAAAAIASGLAGDPVADGTDIVPRAGSGYGERPLRVAAAHNEPERAEGSGRSGHDGEPRHAGPVPAASRRDWLHETGLHGEEAAAELGTYTVPGAPGRTLTGQREEGTGNDADVRGIAADIRGADKALGWSALLFGVASLFIWPFLLGATGAVLGYMAYRQGARSLGVWSMTLGFIAVAAYLLLSPLYAALT